MELLGRYQPLYVVGRGGMGTIEVAIERGITRTDSRVVALKRMLPGVRDRRHADMFMREARLATLLNHPNVVHAFAFGEQDDELLIAMEYVEGETLASLQAALAARGQRIPLYVVAHILAELCDGLHAAHELRDVSGAPLGVVHRDVCPHNVMLSYRGDVKLLDFGVAKLDSAHLTKTGEVKGKTAYMSPEQAMGESLDGRSDLYGVGAMLFELVTGNRMWTGHTDLELLRQLALAEPPKLADVAPDAPPALHDLHARLVARKAKDRPDDASVVAAALRAIAAEATTSARRTLVRLLDEAYAETAREKRQRLELALAHRDDDPRSGENGLEVAVAGTRAAPRVGSRVAPWLYAFLGAAVATTAVLFVARNRPTAAPAAPQSSTTSSAAVSAQVASSSPTLDVTPVTSAALATQTQPASTQQRGPRIRSTAAHTSAPPPPPPSSTAHPHPPIDVDTHPF